MDGFQKSFFKFLARINKIILPKYRHRDLAKLSKLDKLSIAYRYYVTRNSL
jgi:hypothetical protein